VEKPEIRYARSGSVYVAYQVFGEGRFDLVVVPGLLSNIEFGWEFESWRNYYGTLASFARVLLFDKRGTGISDFVQGAPSVEERMDDVRAVMDAAGSERAALIGTWTAPRWQLCSRPPTQNGQPRSSSTPRLSEEGGHPTTRGEAATKPTVQRISQRGGEQGTQ
jgi:hypothetical protein